jgi:GMP synthase (glutamine-hydrolysing)
MTVIDLFEKEAIRIEEEAKHTPLAGKVEWFLQGTLYVSLQFSLLAIWMVNLHI